MLFIYIPTETEVIIFTDGQRGFGFLRAYQAAQAYFIVP